MKNLTTFAFIFELVVASVAYGALFLWPMVIYAKIFFGSAVILLVALNALQALEHKMLAQAAMTLNQSAFHFVESKLNQSDVGSLEEALARSVSEQRFLAIAGGQGSAYAFILCVRFSLWLVGGALMAIYVLPELLKKYV